MIHVYQSLCCLSLVLRATGHWLHRLQTTRYAVAVLHRSMKYDLSKKLRSWSALRWKRGSVYRNVHEWNVPVHTNWSPHDCTEPTNDTNTGLTCPDMDGGPLKVLVLHYTVEHWSWVHWVLRTGPISCQWFTQIPWMLNWFGVWGVWSRGQSFRLSVTLHETLLNGSCGLLGLVQ